MSDQNSPTPDPSEAVPGYTPPAASEPAAPSAEPPAYSPPAAAGGYEPPAATPPAYTPPPAPSYEPPAAPPPAYTPPPTGGYEPPAPGAYSAPAAGGYSQPPAPGGGYPEPTGFPPAAGYGQQPAYGTDPSAYSGGGVPNLPLAPVGGAPLADWPKRALGALIDYVAPSIIISILANVVGSASSNLGSVVSFVLGIGWWVYLGYKSGTTGVTFGRSIAKTKLISEATGGPVGVQTGIIRQFAHIIDTIICYVGWLFPLWDVKKQTLADKIMKTVVVDNSADPGASTYSWT